MVSPYPALPWTAVCLAGCLASRVRSRAGALALVLRGFQTLVEKEMTIPGDFCLLHWADVHR